MPRNLAGLLLLVLLGGCTDGAPTRSPTDPAPAKSDVHTSPPTLPFPTVDATLPPSPAPARVCPHQPGRQTHVLIAPHWEEGDWQTTQQSKTRIDTRSGSAPTIISGRGLATRRVVEVTPTSIRLRIEPGPFSLDSDALSMDPLIASLSQILAGVAIEYETDELGIPLRLVDWDEVVQLSNRVMDLTLEEMSAMGSREETTSLIRSEVQRLPSDREVAEPLMMQDIVLYHALAGTTFDLDQTLEYSTQVVSPLGGPRFRSEAPTDSSL